VRFKSHSGIRNRPPISRVLHNLCGQDNEALPERRPPPAGALDAWLATDGFGLVPASGAAGYRAGEERRAQPLLGKSIIRVMRREQMLMERAAAVGTRMRSIGRGNHMG
jgi:hypothetical protein